MLAGYPARDSILLRKGSKRLLPICDRLEALPHLCVDGLIERDSGDVAWTRGKRIIKRRV